MDMVLKEKPLTSAEQKRLCELEGLIRDNFLAYVTVGSALLEIRESRLYRNREGRTWERYCRELWDMSHQRADQLIAAKSVAENLTTIVVKNNGSPDWELLPATESQARELVELAPEEQRKVWRYLIECREAAKSGDRPFRLTAKVIKAAVSKHKGNEIARCARDAVGNVAKSSKSKYRKSEEFAAAFAEFMQEIASEAESDWLHTSRQVAFDALCSLARAVGECGEESVRTKGVVWRGNNVEKLLAGGFSLFRLSPDKLLIERLVSVDQWQAFGEYKTAEQGLTAFADLMLEAGNLQVME